VKVWIFKGEILAKPGHEKEHAMSPAGGLGGAQ